MKKFNLNQFAILSILAVGSLSQVATATPPAPSGAAAFSAQASLKAVGTMADALNSALTDIDFGTAISDFSFIEGQLRQLPVDMEPLQKSVENIVSAKGDLDPIEVRNTLKMGLDLSKKHYNTITLTNSAVKDLVVRLKKVDNSVKRLQTAAKAVAKLN